MKKRSADDSEELSPNKSIRIYNRNPCSWDYSPDFLMAIKKGRFELRIPNHIKLDSNKPLFDGRSYKQILYDFVNLILNLKKGENPPYFSVISGCTSKLTSNTNYYSQISYALKLPNHKYSIWLYTYSHRENESYITPLCSMACKFVNMKYEIAELDFTIQILNFDASQIVNPEIDYLYTLWDKVCPYMPSNMFFNFIENCDPYFKDLMMTKFKHYNLCKCMICNSTVTSCHPRRCLSRDDITYIKSAYQDCKASTHVHSLCWTQLKWFEHEFSQIM